MPCALLQKDLSIPPVEQLKRAFRQVPFLTDIDAHTLAQDAYGILVKNLAPADAAKLQSALRNEGIETEIVQQQSLPAIPQAKFVRRIDCQPEALMIYDPLGRGFRLEWGHVMMIAAGDVFLNKFKTIRTTRPVTRHVAGLSGAISYEDTVTDTRTREERSHHLLLEIILRRGVLRYSLEAQQIDFTCLGARRTKSVEVNFQLLVRDLASFTPHAILNRGAYYIRKNVSEIFTYPSKNAFFEEIIWLLWRMVQAEGGGS